MAAELSQDAVLAFLRSGGGSVRNADLLLHFRPFLRDHAERIPNRELFKKFVNSLATVQQLDGVSYVVLRRKFKRLNPDEGGAASGSAATGSAVLPAAGIIRTNNTTAKSSAEEANPSLKQRHSSTSSSERPPPNNPQLPAQHSKLPGGFTPPVRAPGVRQIGVPGGFTPTVRAPGGAQQIGPPGVFIPPVRAPGVHQVGAPGGVRAPGGVHHIVAPGGVRAPGGVHQVGAPGGFTPPVRAPGGIQQIRAPGGSTPPVRAPGGVQQVAAPGQFTPPVRAPGGVQQIEAPGRFTPPIRAPGGVQQVGAPGCFIPPIRARRGVQQVGAPEDFSDPGAVHQVQQSRVELGAPGDLTSPVRAPGGVLHNASVQPLHQEPPPPQAVAPVRRFRYRPSYKSAMSCDDDEEEEEAVPVRRGSSGGAWTPSGLLGDMRTSMSASTPCITAPPAPPSADSFSSSERPLPKIYIQDVQGAQVPAGGHHWGAGSPGLAAGEVSRRSLPAEVLPRMPSPGPGEDVAPGRGGLQPEPGLGPNCPPATAASSPHLPISPSSDTGVSISDWPPSPRRLKWRSSEDLQPTAGRTGRGTLSQRTSSESLTNLSSHNKTSGPWSHSTGHLLDDQEPKARLMPRNLSTGDLLGDSEGVEWCEGSTSSPPLGLHPRVAGPLSSQSRSRMCRSLGADLDQLLREEAQLGGGGSEAARLHRLHLLSSSLSLGNNLSSSSLSSSSTPPRCSSMADLLEGATGPEGRANRRSHAAASTHQHQGGSSRQSLVPLDPREHDWLVKAAAGAWPDIYLLFREDSSLLNRRDFISGFTVLHWIAKHGDHRVLNTLWYGVEKAGLSFDINARSMCGQTPLHIAAIHGHKNILRLLVGKFSADVRLRDTAGKKAWQYLSASTPADIFQLLGGGAGRGRPGGQRPEAGRKQEEQPRRRRRHHFSSASSGQRPHSAARVKRSTSLAAFLKHKAKQHIHQSDSPCETLH